MQGARSVCFRVQGATEVTHAASGKLVAAADAKTLMCSRKHGGIPCCSGEWRTEGTRTVTPKKQKSQPRHSN